jgi:hypothetical protein
MITRVALVFLMVCMVTPATFAGFVLRFETSPGAGSSAGFGAGTTNNVNLYLVATESADITQLSASGVSTANIGFPGDPDAFDPADVIPGVTLAGVGTIQSSNPSAFFDTRFGGVTVNQKGAAWTASEGTTGSGVFGSPIGSEYYVLLGGFSVTAGSNVGEMGTLSLVAAEVELSFHDEPNFTNINVTSFGNFTFTAVPEPSAFLLMGMAVTGGAAFLRRRKGSAQPAPAAKE